MVYLSRMDIFEVRRQAVLKLIAGPRFGGSRAAFSRDTGINQSYVTRMLKPIGDANGKRIADNMAFKIEDSLSLPPGSIHSPGHLLSPAEREEGIERARQRAVRVVDSLGEAVELLAGALSEASPLSRKGAAPILANLAENPAGWMQVASLLNAMLKPAEGVRHTIAKAIRPAPSPSAVKAPASGGRK